MELDLSSFFKTKAQATDFSGRLATVSQAIYQTDFILESVLMEQFGLQKKDAFISLLRDNTIRVDSPSDLKSFFDTVQEKIASLPLLSMTVAFEPKEQTLQALSEWFFLNIKRQVLFEITVDPTLIAGAAISFNGKHQDFSVRSKFDHVIADASDHNNQLPAPGSDEVPPIRGKHQSLDSMHLGR